MIKLENVVKSFINEDEKQIILENLCLTIKKGDKIVIWGKSGSGKTTLLQLLGGFYEPDEGIIESSFEKKDIGWVFQSLAIIPELNVWENIIFSSGNPPEINILNYGKKLAKMMHIEHILNSKIQNVSQGELQRACIIRSLIMKPKVLLIDEPTASLDQVNKQLVLDLIFQSQLLKNTIIVMVTHDPIVKTYNANHYQIQNRQLVKLD